MWSQRVIEVEDDHMPTQADGARSIAMWWMLIFLLAFSAGAPSLLMFLLVLMVVSQCLRAAHVAALRARREQTALPGEQAFRLRTRDADFSHAIDIDDPDPAARRALLLTQLTQRLSALTTQVQTMPVDPLTDQEIATLPVHTFQPRAPAAPHGDGPATASSQKEAMQEGAEEDEEEGEAAEGEKRPLLGAKSAASVLSEQGAASKDTVQVVVVPGTAAEDPEAIVCSICLEAAAAGDEIMSLPCCHMYHAGCIRPWLQLHGRKVACPMCKHSIFESTV
eukprot:CAMPEP_0119107398 /NCGR_PEP_ID=MMETSP1180-20130426/9814_1 /TAXON_ID=3052 ORGANISM="Chlamydomonas cf sp, Strain CCMP681" /NCGR_SAMPLE_ID=MMETSP1180 /ASSEMBLY_ACC=CAM_ASM_000741 /LENGTH=278 /DNA_ID=CAMNT_0007092877 /DNA_START=44 /DNA_END=880 /DNA_ORIENTATION=-